ATYTIGATTTITVDGATGTLAGITVGAKVQLRLSALDPTVVLSVNARTMSPGAGGPGGEHGDGGHGSGKHGRR
ncbi:MAG: hypothetical protein ACHRHE_02940, partial [Tepidisphaerales bacterium]